MFWSQCKIQMNKVPLNNGFYLCNFISQPHIHIICSCEILVNTKLKPCSKEKKKTHCTYCLHSLVHALEDKGQ